MNWQQLKALRAWVREVNGLGLKHGYEDMAGTPNDPDPEYVERFENGETPEQVIASDFASHIASQGRQALSKPEVVAVIAKVISAHGDPESFGQRELKVIADLQALPYDTDLICMADYEALAAQNAELRADTSRLDALASSTAALNETLGMRVFELEQEAERYEAAMREVMTQVDGNIRETVRDCVNGQPDVQDIYDYCDRIEEAIIAALSRQSRP